MTIWVDPVRWFDNIGNCRNCGKQGHGKLMGPSNESYGVFCQRCADTQLRRADKKREKNRTVNHATLTPHRTSITNN